MGRKAKNYKTGTNLYSQWNKLKIKSYKELDFATYLRWIADYEDFDKWANENGRSNERRFLGKIDKQKPHSPTNTVFLTKDEYFKNKKRYVVSIGKASSIRYEHFINNIPQRELAELFCLSRHVICEIINRRK